MGWVKQVHPCEPPERKDLNSVWRCDTCGRLFKVRRNWYDDISCWFVAPPWTRMWYWRRK